MSEVADSGEHDSDIRNLYQDRPTQDTVSGGSPIRQTRAKTYSHSAKKGKDKGIRKGSECSGDDDTVLPRVRKSTRSRFALIVQVNIRRDMKKTRPLCPFVVRRWLNCLLHGMAKWVSTSPQSNSQPKATTMLAVRHSIIIYIYIYIYIAEWNNNVP